MRIDSISAGAVAEHARGEQVRVEPDDVVAGLLGQRDQDGADVAVVAGDEYAQGSSSWIAKSRDVGSWSLMLPAGEAAAGVALWKRAG